MIEKIWNYLDEHEYFLLIASHVAMLVFYPFVVESVHASLWMSLLITLILVTGLYAAHSHDKFVMRTMLLGVCALILTWTQHLFMDEHIITLCLNVVGLLFFCVITYNLIIDLHSMRRITQHMIFGAVAGYLLVGLIGAFVFAIIEIIIPGSFSGFATEVVSFPDFVYYSYVSITTLGYGDILPVGYHAQSWSIIFTIAGQMYLAVLIGMLVGKYIKK